MRRLLCICFVIVMAAVCLCGCDIKEEKAEQITQEHLQAFYEANKNDLIDSECYAQYIEWAKIEMAELGVDADTEEVKQIMQKVSCYLGSGFEIKIKDTSDKGFSADVSIDGTTFLEEYKSIKKSNNNNSDVIKEAIKKTENYEDHPVAIEMQKVDGMYQFTQDSINAIVYVLFDLDAEGNKLD